MSGACATSIRRRERGPLWRQWKPIDEGSDGFSPTRDLCSGAGHRVHTAGKLVTITTQRTGEFLTVTAGSVSIGTRTAPPGGVTLQADEEPRGANGNLTSARSGQRRALPAESRRELAGGRRPVSVPEAVDALVYGLLEPSPPSAIRLATPTSRGGNW